MTLHPLAGDDFARLDSHDHRTAVRVFNAEISGFIAAMAAAPDKAAPTYKAGLTHQN